MKKVFTWLLVVNFMVWSLVPFLRGSLPMDTQEAIVWGKFCLWGTTKHPPFSGWLAYSFYRLFGEWDKSLYFLSQFCVVLGLIYIYRLARCFMNENKAVLAALAQWGIIYYNFSTPEFNVNVVSLALWPMCAYYFWLAYRQNKLADWLLFGLLAAVNLLNKYISAVLLLSIALFVIVDKRWRQCLRNPKIYVAALLGAILLVPHILWLYQTDFVMIEYIASRSSVSKVAFPWNHMVYPLKFLLAQLLFAAAALVTYGYFYKRYSLIKEANYRSVLCSEYGNERSNLLFIGILTVLPVMLFAVISLVSGNALKSMWGYPCLFMLGTAFFYFLPMELPKGTQKHFAYVMFVWSMVFALAYALQCMLTKSERFTLNNRELVAQLEQKWQQKSAQEMEYVVADVWYADMVALYAQNDVKPMVWFSPRNNPWFDAADFKEKGALLISSNIDEYRGWQKTSDGKITPPRKMTLALTNYFGKTKYKDIYYGFYNIREAKHVHKK